MSAAENWPQWRGPGSQGISNEAALATEWSPTKNIAWKTELPSSPIIWGDRIFLTSAVEGDVVAGAKAVGHTVDGQVWVHPDSVAADRKHALKVLALDAKTGKVLWDRTAYESGPVARNRPHQHRRRAGVLVARDRERADLHSGEKHLFAIGPQPPAANP